MYSIISLKNDAYKNDLIEIKYAKKNGFDYKESEKNIGIVNSFIIFDKLHTVYV